MYTTYMYNAKERFLLLLQRKMKHFAKDVTDEDREKNIAIFEAGYNQALLEVIDEVEKLS